MYGLIDRQGASNAGHAAMLVRNDEKGWELISKNGGKYGIFGRSDESQLGNETNNYYSTLAEFIKDTEPLQIRYEEGFRIKTDDKQDAIMSKIGKIEANKYYLLLGANCMDVVQNAMLGAGLYPWKTFKGYKSKTVHEGGDLYPNDEYLQIKSNNEGEVIDFDGLRNLGDK